MTEARPDRPWATHLLLAANLTWFVAMLIMGVSAFNPTRDALIQTGANYPPRTLGGEWWRLLTCMFVHIGILHLGVNAYALWGLGGLIERLTGRAAMLSIYLVSGLAGSLTSAAFQSFTVSAGASGAIFGLMGGLIGLLVARRHLMPPQLVRALGQNVVLVVLLNVILGLSIRGLDWFAHAGGLVAGALFGALVLGGPVVDKWYPSVRRTLLMTSLALLVLTASLRLLPTPPDLDAVWRQFSAEEQRLFARQQQRLGQLQGQQISPQEWADEVHNELIPSWKKLIDSLTFSREPRGPIGDLVRGARDYAAARMTWLELSVRVAQQPTDTALQDELQAQDRKIDLLLKRLNAEADGPRTPAPNRP